MITATDDLFTGANALLSQPLPTPKPGLHYGVPFAEYLKWDLPSQSAIKHGRASMKHYKAAADRELIKPPTDSMVCGAALHTAFLEPEQAATRIAKWEGDRRAGKDWEQFKLEHHGKALLTKNMHANVTGMVKSLRADPDVAKWIGRAQAVEVSAIGEIEGVLMKGRVDALTKDPLWDLKMISSADDQTIDRTIYNFGYHIQGFVYRTLFGRNRFCLAFVEQNYPHDVSVVELSEKWIEIGKRETTGLLQQIKFCRESNAWPGRCPGIRTSEPPDWVIQRHSSAHEITFGGESLLED